MATSRTVRRTRIVRVSRPGRPSIPVKVTTEVKTTRR